MFFSFNPKYTMSQFYSLFPFSRGFISLPLYALPPSWAPPFPTFSFSKPELKSLAEWRGFLVGCGAWQGLDYALGAQPAGRQSYPASRLAADFYQ
ncbi:hypothetical protein GKZ68_09815 [Hymenobacter sp. BRD128]|uniref:hypothetical protein n=1 Tax=Hymenobacter sp. BRD128 TaxID=2675878 RepID=UPI0015666BBA|nr:hypothetical protein [Hymenobacter sp. BRD128]QKG56896.1 hypothetical protein GKZ68_09815 [Hymenobacter sp. BRD128]